MVQLLKDFENNFSFNLSAPQGYKNIKDPDIVSYKKMNKTRLDSIQFFLEDSNHDPVDFNPETLSYTIQIIKIFLTKNELQ